MDRAAANGIGIVSLIFALASLFVWALPTGAIAVMLGAISWNGGRSAMGLAGAILGGLSVGFVMLMTILLWLAGNPV